MMHPGTEGTSQLVLFCQYKVAPEANETLEALQGMCDGSIRGCEIAIKTHKVVYQLLYSLPSVPRSCIKDVHAHPALIISG